MANCSCPSRWPSNETSCCQLLAQLDQKIKTIERWLEHATADGRWACNDCGRIPALGLLTSICVRYTLEDVESFCRPLVK